MGAYRQEILEEEKDIKFARVFGMDGREIYPHAYWVQYLMALLDWESPRPQKKKELLVRAGVPWHFYSDYMMNNPSFWRWLNAQMRHFAPSWCAEAAQSIRAIAEKLKEMALEGLDAKTRTDASREYRNYVKDFAPLLQTSDFLSSKTGTEGEEEDSRYEEFLRDLPPVEEASLVTGTVNGSGDTNGS